MNRTLKLFAFAGALALSAGACADPADGITAAGSVASQDGGGGGTIGSGTRTDPCIPGQSTTPCPPPPQP